MDTELFKSSICLVILSGIPACGKTTFAKLMMKQLGNIHTYGEEDITKQSEKDIFGVIVISYDELIPDNIPVGDMSQQKWKEYREEIVLCIDQLLYLDTLSLDKLTKPSFGVTDLLWEKFCNILRVQMFPASPVAIVIDDNMYYRSMRHRYYQLARRHTCGFCQIFITCSVEEALQRNKQRSCPVPPDVIVAIETKLEPANIQENHWEKNTLTIDTETDVVSQLPSISHMIKTAMRNPVPPLDETDPNVIVESRQICSNNIIHQSDQILRKIVSQRMADMKSHSTDRKTLQYLSKKYIDIRKACLEKIKTGHVTFPVTADKPNISCDINSELYQQILRMFEQLMKEVT